MNAMMKYKLSKTKTICPFCGKEDFQPYCAENSNEALPYQGYCSRCNSCITPLEYHFAQEQIIADYSNDYSSRALKNAGIKYDEAAPVKMLERKFITAGLIYNNLFKYLSTKFDRNEVKMICNIYGLATHKVGKWFGAAIFYQYNKDDQRQAVKIIQYDEKTGHRITGNDMKDENKDLLYQKPLIEQGKYCLFGRHLLNRPDSEGKPICIVESEKTAIIASIVYPEAIWMAAGSCYYLDYEKKIQDIENREIILFPDVDGKYEPIDIDENTGVMRCINWYLINDNPHGLGLPRLEQVSVSGFLEKFIEGKCKDCCQKEWCSSSPYFVPENAIIQNKKIGFKLKNHLEIKDIPKVKTKLISCPFRGWDLGDYIVYSKQKRENFIEFKDLKKPVGEQLQKTINDITSKLEKKIEFKEWREHVKSENRYIKEPKQTSDDNDRTIKSIGLFLDGSFLTKCPNMECVKENFEKEPQNYIIKENNFAPSQKCTIERHLFTEDSHIEQMKNFEKVLIENDVLFHYKQIDEMENNSIKEKCYDEWYVSSTCELIKSRIIDFVVLITSKENSKKIKESTPKNTTFIDIDKISKDEGRTGLKEK